MFDYPFHSLLVLEFFPLSSPNLRLLPLCLIVPISFLQLLFFDTRKPANVLLLSRFYGGIKYALFNSIPLSRSSFLTVFPPRDVEFNRKLDRENRSREHYVARAASFQERRES